MLRQRVICSGILRGLKLAEELETNMNVLVFCFSLLLSIHSHAGSMGTSFDDDLLRAADTANEEKLAAQQKLDRAVWEQLNSRYQINSPLELFKAISATRMTLAEDQEKSFDFLMAVVESRNDINKWHPLKIENISFQVNNHFIGEGLVVLMKTKTAGCFAVDYEVELIFGKDRVTARSQQIQQSRRPCFG